MNLGDLRRLGCPHCKKPTDLLVLFDHLEDGWRDEVWSDVRCPECGGSAQLALEGEDVAIGFVEAAPRRRFEPTERVRQPGLRVAASPDGIVVELLHRRWVVARTPR